MGDEPATAAEERPGSIVGPALTRGWCRWLQQTIALFTWEKKLLGKR